MKVVWEFRSALPRHADDITCVTQASRDRAGRLVLQAATWPGVISAAVMCAADDDARAAIAEVQRICEAIEGAGRCKIDLVLLLVARSGEAHSYYPINALRNAALARARTDLVFLCDVDFVVWQVCAGEGFFSRACCCCCWLTLLRRASDGSCALRACTARCGSCVQMTAAPS